MSTHQYAMVMDLNKCIGCHTCTIACKKQWSDGDGMDYMYWNNVETHPGTGYPRGWHTLGGGFDAQRHLRPSPLPSRDDYGHALEYDYGQRLYEGKNKPVMPHKDPHYTPNWDEDVGGFDTNNPYFFYLPRICNHCTHPACLEACPRKAIYKRTEDGIVLIDQERCQGYQYCIKACPYKKIYFNAVTGKSEKCIFCYPRLEKGKVNACAAQCPGRIRFVGILDDPDSPVHKLVRKYKVALGLFPDKGTEPNVYYVPPFAPAKAGRYGASVLDDPRLPLDYLKYLFGPKVVEVIAFLESELKRAQSGAKSDVLQLLIGRDEHVRYRIVPDVIRRAAPADVQERTNGRPGGPELQKLGSPREAAPEGGQDHAHDDHATSTPVTAAVAGAFGLPAMPAAACATKAVTSACGGCAISRLCSGSDDATAPAHAPEGKDKSWY